jgi:hypothetical protein
VLLERSADQLVHFILVAPAVLKLVKTWHPLMLHAWRHPALHPLAALDLVPCQFIRLNLWCRRQVDGQHRWLTTSQTASRLAAAEHLGPLSHGTFCLNCRTVTHQLDFCCVWPRAGMRILLVACPGISAAAATFISVARQALSVCGVDTVVHHLQIHGQQCLSCTYSVREGIPASKSVCTAVHNPSRVVIVGRNPGARSPQADVYAELLKSMQTIMYVMTACSSTMRAWRVIGLTPALTGAVPRAGFEPGKPHGAEPCKPGAVWPSMS